MSNNEIILNRDDLYKKVWTIPMVKLAKNYGLSDNGLRKICKKLNIPIPNIGHWAKVSAGHKVIQKPLPALKEGDISDYTLSERSGQSPSDEEDERIAYEKRPENKILVSNSLRNPHHLIGQANFSIKNSGYFGASNLNISVADNNVPRALRIMDALLKALNKRGFTVSIEKIDYKSKTLVDVYGESIEFRMFERSVKTLKENYNVDKYDRFYQPYELVLNGKLSIIIDEHLLDSGLRKTLNDGTKQRLEDHLNSFIIFLIKVSDAKKRDKLVREKWRKEREEERQREEEIERKIHTEAKKVESLLKDAHQWKESRLLRDYLTAIINAPNIERLDLKTKEDKDNWLLWAEEQADRLDPLVKSPPSILDINNQY